MSDLPRLARHWMNQTCKGKGLRLEAADLDLLNGIGVGEMIASRAAELQRDQCLKRTARSIPVASIAYNGTGEQTDRSAAPSSKSSGMTPPRVVIAGFEPASS